MFNETPLMTDDVYEAVYGSLATVSHSHIDEAISAVVHIAGLADSHSVFWAEALGLAKRVINL